ncbi:MAG: 8-amino-7-oxononanoate synthase [Chitinophaga sp.]|jgi:8-amino-7-oxononanoate synthase|nr:8-amino-7-oxononanoate synthase [Chitinophaga sp.]
MNESFLDKKLAERKNQNAFRSLKINQQQIDFCSNDYLGIVKSKLLLSVNTDLSSGSTGSRLLAGNYELIETVENQIASFHQSEAALIFNSGYDANVGLLSSVPQKEDTIIYDFLSHASIRDGVRLSFAQTYSFKHNDIADLEKKLKHATGNIFVVTESVFSMDGDICPLNEIVSICEKYKAHLIIDEAHATGIIGERGEGLVQLLQIQNKIFARVHTFGKACGCHGAVVLGSQTLRDYLINFARSFIYTTALPQHAVAAIQRSYQIFAQMQNERKHLADLIVQFQAAAIQYEKLISHTPIQAVIVTGNENVKALSAKIQQAGFDVRPVLYPTVPKGKERLRIVLHAFNTEKELHALLNLLQ